MNGKGKARDDSPERDLLPKSAGPRGRNGSGNGEADGGGGEGSRKYGLGEEPVIDQEKVERLCGLEEGMFFLSPFNRS
jgi:hypothetical protein